MGTKNIFIKFSITVKLFSMLIGFTFVVIFLISALQFIEGKIVLERQILQDMAAINDGKKEIAITLVEGYFDSMSLSSSRRTPRGYLVKKAAKDPEADAFKEESIRTLTDAKGSNPLFLEVDVVDLEGRVAVSTEPKNIGKVLSSEPVFREGLKGPYASDIHRHRDDKLIIDISVPTYNPYIETKEVVGIYKTTLLMGDFIEILSRYNGLGKTGESILVRREGDTIVNINPLRHISQGQSSFAIPYNSKDAGIMRKALTQQDGIAKVFDYRGQEVLAAYQYVPALRCGIITKVDTAEAFAPVRHLLLMNMLISITLFAFLALILFFFSRTLTGPIKELNRAAAILSSGDFSIKVKSKSGDELGQLAEAFNSMAHNLSRITASRDELNAEIRTREKIEDDLRRSNKRLKEAQDRLVQTEKMAAVGLLAGGVAHEINNPLTGVLNNIQLLKIIVEGKRELSPDEIRGLLNVVEESALRCRNITRALLDFSRASKHQFVPVQLSDVIENVLQFVSGELKLDNIGIGKDIMPDAPAIAGDPQLLQQAFLGLLTNAKWAIGRRRPPSEGLITIKTGFDGTRQKIFLSVTDNGIGIEEKDMPKIFEPFFTTKEVGEGTGLGLAITYNIVKRHEGDIKVESKPNIGTVVIISFPIPRQT